jgi:hypothetical protein
VTTLDITDFVEVNDNPQIVQAEAVAAHTQEGIDGLYSVIKNVLNKDPALNNNQLAKAVRSKLVKVDQTLQCIGPRGFLTDIDSYIYRKPIMQGYFKGIRTLEDSMKESRSAAKALAFSVDPLKKAEYFSRRQQLICQNVKHLYRGDCGSKHYLVWQVRGEEKIEGVVTRASDLNTIFGKYYLDEDKNYFIISNAFDRIVGKGAGIRGNKDFPHQSDYRTAPHRGDFLEDRTYPVPFGSEICGFGLLRHHCRQSYGGGECGTYQVCRKGL